MLSYSEYMVSFKNSSECRATYTLLSYLYPKVRSPQRKGSKQSYIQFSFEKGCHHLDFGFESGLITKQQEK